MTMKAHTYYILFGRPPIGGSFPLPPGGATALQATHGKILWSPVSPSGPVSAFTLGQRRLSSNTMRTLNTAAYLVDTEQVRQTRRLPDQ